MSDAETPAPRLAVTITGENGSAQTFQVVSVKAKSKPAALPENATMRQLLAAVRSTEVVLLLQEAEAATSVAVSLDAVTRHLETIGLTVRFIAEDVPQLLPAFDTAPLLARVKEAVAKVSAFGNIPEGGATGDQARAVLAALRVAFSSILEVERALEATAAAKERAAHARAARAQQNADLAAAPAEEREKIEAALDEARRLKTSVEARTYETIRGTTNVPLEPLGNSLARGQTSTPAVVVPGPENALEFRTREAGEERPPRAAIEKRSREVTLTGEEVLGPVERQVWRAILVQAARVRNPADLVGVSVDAYAAANDLTYSGAKKAIEKAVDNLFALCLTLGDSYAAERGLPTRVRFLDAVYGERKKLVEGYYLVQLGTTMIKHLAGGRAIQFPLFPALDFQSNPNADLFIQLFSINKAQNIGKSNENIVSVERLAQAAGLLHDRTRLGRARAIIERDLHAAEKCGSGQRLAPFKAHRYRDGGKRISTTRALDLPPRDWLKLTVEVEWNEGALNFSRKERAVRNRQERRAIEDARATIRKGTKK